MREQSFYGWLMREAASSRLALIAMYETRDRLLYVDAPVLRKRYLSVFGETEDAVLQAELENSMLKRKIEMIQAALNRRENVDLGKIDDRINQERAERLSELETDDTTLNELPRLTERETQSLKALYHDIIDSFHPAINTDVSETQHELYDKALAAFKMQDVEAMQVIHDSLFVRHEEGILQEPSAAESSEKEDFHAMASALTTDYTLAKTLYPFFSPLEDDIVVTNAIADCTAKRKALEEEIAAIKSGFPFNAESTLNDPSKTEEYRVELRIRAQRCEDEKAQLQRRIKQLTEGR
jgi:hypothetical protein